MARAQTSASEATGPVGGGLTRRAGFRAQPLQDFSCHQSRDLLADIVMAPISAPVDSGCHNSTKKLSSPGRFSDSTQIYPYTPDWCQTLHEESRGESDVWYRDMQGAAGTHKRNLYLTWEVGSKTASKKGNL